MKIILTIAYVFAACIILSGCKKSDFLNAKPNLILVQPNSLKDCQAILDNSPYMNGIGIGLSPALGEAASDDYYVLPNHFINGGLSEPVYKNLYTWDDNLYGHERVRPWDWGYGYRAIYYANVVLDELSNISIENYEREAYNNIKGSALFYRSYILHALSQVFCEPYDDNTANTALGLPLRMTSDINEKVQRSTVRQTYDKIITDLEESIQLLPDTPLYKSRPSKAAAYGLLARVFLSMRKYDSALKMADSCLTLKNTLMDFNMVDATASTPFNRFNDEVIFCSVLVITAMQLINPYYARVDSTLFKMYDSNDLRKEIFYGNAKKDFSIPNDNGYYFKGSYDGTFNGLFSGLATDEIYLIRAECHARKNDVSNAMKDLNFLLSKRWKSGYPMPIYNIDNPNEALKLVLLERRKELVFRGLRWSDIRRLNKEEPNISIIREVNNEIFTLEPHDKRWTFLIPPDVMIFNGDWQQNPR